MAANVQFQGLIRQYLCPMISEFSTLMTVYHNYQQVVEAILMTLQKCVGYLISVVHSPDSAKIYEACLNTIQTYATWNSGRLTLESDSQDDAFTDIILLMKLLQKLVIYDIINSSGAKF